MNESRKNILHNLLEFTLLLPVLREQLPTLTWDWDGIQVDCKVEHLQNLLQRFLDQNLSTKEVEDWANLIEGREDIDFPRSILYDLEVIIHDLANPILAGVLTREKAQGFLKHQLRPSMEMLKEDMIELSSLLQEMGDSYWFDKINEILNIEGFEHKGSAYQEIYSWYGGTGSITDLMISSLNGHKVADIGEEAINQRLQILGSRIYAALHLVDKKFWQRREIKLMERNNP